MRTGEPEDKNSILTSVVAVSATLAGSTLTFLFQRHSARRAERFPQAQQFWQERVSAYSALGATVTDYRRSQNDRWHREQAGQDDPQSVTAREESYQRRADATAALCRVRLVCGDPALNRLAQDALDAATEIHEAPDEQDRASRGRQARLALDHFLDHASAQVRG